MKLLSRQIETLQRNALDSSQYLRREMIEINLVPEDIQDMQLEESICQVSFLLIALDHLSNNCNLIATMWEFIQSLVHRPFPEIMTSKFVNLNHLLTKTEVTVSGLELEGSQYFINCYCSFKLLQQIWIKMNFKGQLAGLSKQNILINFHQNRLLDGVNTAKTWLTIDVECVKSQLMIARNHQIFVTLTSFRFILNAIN